jgi:hypothetical protein
MSSVEGFQRHSLAAFEDEDVSVMMERVLIARLINKVSTAP